MDGDTSRQSTLVEHGVPTQSTLEASEMKKMGDGSGTVHIDMEHLDSMVYRRRAPWTKMSGGSRMVHIEVEHHGDAS